jgi:hypothetical protein
MAAKKMKSYAGCTTQHRGRSMYDGGFEAPGQIAERGVKEVA